MSRPIAIALALVVLAGAAAPVAADEPGRAATAPTGEPGAAAAAVVGQVVPGEVVVKWHDPAAVPAEASENGLAVVAELGPPAKDMPVLVSTEGQPVAQVLADLNADPAVEYAEPNYVISLADDGATAVAVNDTRNGEQYSLDRMRVRDAWGLSTGASNLIAVLDTGVQFDHRDLAGRLVAGHDFVSDDGDASDDNGHGTWVSGIIAANANDGYGIAGISWSDRILPVKIMNAQGTGSTSDLTAGIIYAADRGANIINMSVGGFPHSQYVQDAVDYAWSKGAVLIGAAGNNRREETFYPASFNNVVSVSATQSDDEFANWSSYGPKVDVSAPGASILTTNCTSCPNGSWGDHTKISGTSFATPNVAGVVALIRARYPSYTPSQVVHRLLTTVDDLGYAGWDNRYGLGRVNAHRAVGGSPAYPALLGGDGLEANNGLASARLIPLGTTTNPTIYPAGDVDVFAVDVPRAGRLDVRVTGVVDTTRVPKSSLPVDPIVEIYSAGGTLLKTVDNEWESGTELASVDASGPARFLIRVRNWYANGSRSTYGVTPTYVDTVVPTIIGRTPAPGAVQIAQDGAVTVDFSEPMHGVSGTTMQLRRGDGALVPATVSYSGTRATLQPSILLEGETGYAVTLSGGITDHGGNSIGSTSWGFITARAVVRLSGTDRYSTAAAVSASAFAPGVPVVYVATGRAYPDALAGGPAAAAGGGPLLLTAPSSLPGATANELSRLQPARIVVLGGTGAVSDAVLNALRSYTSGSVTRIGGANRFATAAAISADAFPNGAPVVYLATGANYPDALAAGATAGRDGGPILLVRSDAMPAATAAELARLRPSRIVIMGGPGAVSDAVVAAARAYAGTVVRISGADRYTTAVGLSTASFDPANVTTVYIATGTAFPDGLSGGPVAAPVGAPLLLVRSNWLPGSVADELRRLNPDTVVILGGSSAVSDAVRAQIFGLWP